MLEFYADMMRAKSCKEVVEKAKGIKVDDKCKKAVGARLARPGMAEMCEAALACL
jgi:hypothetical protein